MSVFRLLHLSDFHFGVVTDNENPARKLVELIRGGGAAVAEADVYRATDYAYNKSILTLDSHSETAAFAVAQFVYSHQDDFDAAIITGDLAATGATRDLEVAVDYFCSEYRKNFKIFPRHLNTDRLKFIVPGNHDRYHNVLGNPGNTNVDRLFGDLLPPQPVYSKEITKEDESIALVFGDFCLRADEQTLTRAEKFGFGKAYDDIVQMMMSETESRRNKTPGILPIWCIHFAPFDCHADLAFLDYRKLLEAARQVRVPLVLCGHTHEARVLSGAPAVSVAGSATCCTDARNDIHILDIEINRGRLTVLRENYKLDRRDACFVPDPKVPEDVILQDFVF